MYVKFNVIHCIPISTQNIYRYIRKLKKKAILNIVFVHMLISIAALFTLSDNLL